MQLYERVRLLAQSKNIPLSKLAEYIDIYPQKFNQWLNKKSQKNLWEHLPKILDKLPELRPEWLYYEDGPMLKEANAPCAKQTRPKIVNDLDYYDDALGRIFKLTGIRTTSAFELQTLFGADFKEAKRFISRYMAARAAREAWEAAGADEDTMPPAPEAIPDEWLYYFWTHFGPNPTWVQRGESDFIASPPPLREWPREAERDRLRQELEDARCEIDSLRVRLRSFGWDDVSDKTALSPTSARGEIVGN